MYELSFLYNLKSAPSILKICHKSNYHLKYTYLLTIDILYIPDLILKIIFFLQELFPLRRSKWYQLKTNFCNKSNGQDKEFKYIFLIICRYLNLVKNRMLIFIAKTKFTICYIQSFFTDYGKKNIEFLLNFTCANIKGK